jgi:hypothetical protein
LGFPHLKNVEEIVAFIEQWRHRPQQILKDYNQAVQRYNAEWLK